MENFKQLNELAKEVIKKIKSENKNIICLSGDLGTGKTTFTSILSKQLGTEDDVTSPTFNLLHIYESDELSIHHFDLYRLNSLEEALDLGIEETLANSKNLCIIEWPEIINDIIDKNKTIFIEFFKQEDQWKSLIKEQVTTNS